MSVLTPCYNDAKFIAKLIRSVLNQDYPNIEMIVIDDGSTDDSANIIKSFIPKFKAKGFSLKYFYQKNQGQSVAINNGLKKVCGQFLVWPDSDDCYSSPSAIGKMAQVLIDKPDFSCSRLIYKYKNTKTGKFFKKFTPQGKYKSYLLEDALTNTAQFWYVPGGFMGRMSIF